MGFLTEIKSKVATQQLGQLLTDFGTLSTDQHGREISLALRQHPGQPAHLQIKLLMNGEAHHFQIPCTPDWTTQLERVAQEMRKHTKTA
jgi:hypothetical protein